MPKKALIIYGLICASTIVVLNASKFTFAAGLLQLEVYIAIAGIVFLALGIYMGVQWMSNKTKPDDQYQLSGDQNAWQLSPRELEVLEHMASGLTNQEIADKLFVSLPTIKTHSSNIYQKMNVKRRTQAIQTAIQSGLIVTHTKD